METKNTEKLLFLLKSKGAQTAISLALSLNITSMGARQHLRILNEQGLIESYEKTAGVGRPKLFWQLTEKGHQRFPDTHAFLTAELINSIESAFGKKGIDKIITDREHKMQNKYKQELQACLSLADKINTLAKIRTQEGYMAEAGKNEDGSFYLYENHCPICVAATQCQNFCRSELNLFKNALGDGVKIERQEHIVSGARRCAYLITIC